MEQMVCVGYAGGYEVARIQFDHLKEDWVVDWMQGSMEVGTMEVNPLRRAKRFKTAREALLYVAEMDLGW